MKYSQICRDAAAIIRKGGLCKGTYALHTGEHCAIGAVTRACGVSPFVDARMMGPDWRTANSWAADVCERLREIMDNRSVAAWNDQPERTAEDVAQFLERAAVTFESDEAEAPQ